MHYDVPDGKGWVDNSGYSLDLVPLAPVAVSTTLGVVGALTMGDTIFPPQQELITAVIGSSLKNCFEDGFGIYNTTVDTTVFSSALHAHQYGRAIWVEIHRLLPGETMDDINSWSPLNPISKGKRMTRVRALSSDPYFSFDFQKTTLVNPPFKLKTTDIIISYCQYNTMATKKPVIMGEASDEEMCAIFLEMYPKTPVGPSLCFSPPKQFSQAAFPFKAVDYLLQSSRQVFLQAYNPAGLTIPGLTSTPVTVVSASSMSDCMNLGTPKGQAIPFTIKGGVVLGGMAAVATGNKALVLLQSAWIEIHRTDKFENIKSSTRVGPILGKTSVYDPFDPKATMVIAAITPFVLQPGDFVVTYCQYLTTNYPSPVTLGGVEQERCVGVLAIEDVDGQVVVSDGCPSPAFVRTDILKASDYFAAMSQ
jgi:hypothetical protein